MARQVARQFFGLREAHRELWAPNKPEKWLQIDRQHSSRLAEPPNELFWITCSGMQQHVNDQNWDVCHLPTPPFGLTP